jgi:hypothetical protein
MENAMSDAAVTPVPIADHRQSTATRDGWTVLCGVVLPILALVVELTSNICAEMFFDPLRSTLHVVGYASIAALMTWLVVCDRAAPAVLARQHAAAHVVLGVTLFFAAYFTPMLPISAVAILAIGLGFLSLSPFIVLLTLIGWLRRLHREDPALPIAARVGWCAAGLLAMVFADPLGTWTRVRLHAATTGTPVTRAVAIDQLRRYSSADVVARVFEEGLRPATDPIAYCLTDAEWNGDERLSRVVFQAFGESLPLPRGPRSRFGFDENFDVDGRFASPVLRDGFATHERAVRLQRSAYDTHVDPVAATIVTTWEIEFENPRMWPAEAIGTILLPARAVVGGLTLWVDGQPREAAFGTRSNVSTAYREVTARGRDPALVVSDGPRRVRLSCFPIPPQGRMRMRLHVIGALSPDPTGLADVALPCFEKGDFAVAADGFAPVRHSVVIAGALGVARMSPALRADAEDRLTGALTHADLAARPTVARIAVVEPTRARLWNDDSGVTWSAKAATSAVPGASAFVVVIDASRGMDGRLRTVADALDAIDPRFDVAIVLAGDRPELLTTGGISPALPTRVREATQRLRVVPCVGGRDNAAALTLALDLIGPRDDARIVWVHAPQAMSLEGESQLAIALDLASRAPRVVSIATTAVADSVLRGFREAGLDVDERVDADVGQALASAFVDVETAGAPARLVCARADDAARATGLRVEHAADIWRRLAVYDDVLRLVGTTRADHVEQAQKLAIAARLVTPVTGAVVLETDAQYQRFGLSAPEPASAEISAAPEPETYLMLALAGLALFFVRARRGGGA